MFSTMADLLLRATDRGIGVIATAAARRSASLGAAARFTATGRVINIGHRAGVVSIGAHTLVSGHLMTFAHSGRISVGVWCFIGAGSRIWSSAEVVIGNRVLISHGVNIHDTDSHPLDAVARFAQTEAILTVGHPADINSIRASPVRIADDAWIGFGATIMKGVTIGERAIVGANAVVREDVPPDGMVAAAPDAIFRRQVRVAERT